MAWCNAFETQTQPIFVQISSRHTQRVFNIHSHKQYIYLLVDRTTKANPNPPHKQRAANHGGQPNSSAGLAAGRAGGAPAATAAASLGPMQRTPGVAAAVPACSLGHARLLSRAVVNPGELPSPAITCRHSQTQGHSSLAQEHNTNTWTQVWCCKNLAAFSDCNCWILRVQGLDRGDYFALHVRHAASLAVPSHVQRQHRADPEDALHTHAWSSYRLAQPCLTAGLFNWS